MFFMGSEEREDTFQPLWLLVKLQVVGVPWCESHIRGGMISG